MKVLDRILRPVPVEATNSLGSFRYGNLDYLTGSMTGSNPVLADSSFRSMVERIHNESGPVSSAVAARALLLSQVQFAWADDQPNSRADLTRTSALDPLQRPGSMTRSQMLFRAELDDSYAGNAYFVRRSGTRRTFRLDPSRVTFVFGSNSDPSFTAANEVELPYDATVTALAYNSASNMLSPTIDDLEVFRAGEFAHWFSEPDPLNWWRGASWITSLIKDVALDGQVTDHQGKFFEHAATPNMVLVMDPSKTPSEVSEYAAVFNEKFAGSDNAYKNWFLGGGADVKVVGAELEKLGLKDLQGGLETRISMRSRVPAVILGAREGLSGSSLNTGNYSAARRLLADGWFSPTVGGLCESLESLTPPPAGKRLAHDPSAVLFLQEDRKDEAEINTAKVGSIRQLVDGGFDPLTAVATIAPEWSSILEHSGKMSVQLQEPGAQANDARTLMGRLGRLKSNDTITAALLEGLDAVTAQVALDVLGQNHNTLDSLRAAMSAALKNEGGPDA